MLEICRRLLLLSLTLGVALAGTPQRIISLSPNTTEILFGVGAFPRVVAVSQYCIYPPETSKLPKVAGWMNSRIETAVALHPDLVVLTESQKPFLVRQLDALHLPWIATPSESLSDIFSAIAQIGAATGTTPAAESLIKDMHRKLDAISAAAKGASRKSVLISVSRTPGTLSELYVATEGSYFIDLIDIAGGRSVVAPAKTGYGKLSKEALLALDPDMIIDLGSDIDAWNDLPELRAVSAKHVYSISGPLVAHPSQFVVETAGKLARILHPEIAWPL